MASLRIRRLTDAEVEEAVGVWERSRWEARPWLEERMNYSHDDNLAHFRQVVVTECDVWLAFEEQRVVGLMALAGSQVEHLYVEPECQGRGIGTALLTKAKELSPQGLTLFTHRRSEGARAFYERRGFQPVAFGISPAPESEPDVKYAWRPAADAGG